MLWVGSTLGEGAAHAASDVGPWGKALPMLRVGGTLRGECCLCCGYVGGPRGGVLFMLRALAPTHHTRHPPTPFMQDLVQLL